MDVQEALKLLQHRLGKEVSYRPVGVRGGLPVYRVDGKLLTERQILAWVASLGGRRDGDLLLKPRVGSGGVA